MAQQRSNEIRPRRAVRSRRVRLSTPCVRLRGGVRHRSGTRVAGTADPHPGRGRRGGSGVGCPDRKLPTFHFVVVPSTVRSPACAWELIAGASISLSGDRLGFEPRIGVAFFDDATRTGGSPGRRAPMCKGTCRPVARSTARTTSRTVNLTGFPAGCGVPRVSRSRDRCRHPHEADPHALAWELAKRNGTWLPSAVPAGLACTDLPLAGTGADIARQLQTHTSIRVNRLASRLLLYTPSGSAARPAKPSVLVWGIIDVSDKA